MIIQIFFFKFLPSVKLIKELYHCITIFCDIYPHVQHITRSVPPRGREAELQHTSMIGGPRAPLCGIKRRDSVCLVYYAANGCQQRAALRLK